MLEILGHADLLHELVLVSVHTRKLTNVREGELKTVCKLERIDIAQSVLNVRVDDKLCETQDFSDQMESVSESRLLSLFGCECLDRLQVHVVIQMQVVQILAMDEQVEHVEALSADLKTSLNPVESSVLEELRLLQLSEQVLLGL
jgi:hypothetical protein